MPHITHVNVEGYETPGTARVTPIWSDVDRAEGAGWVVSSKLVSRLVAALLAGVVTPNPKVATDVNGKTFVSHDLRVLGRTMNADLKRLGF